MMRGLSNIESEVLERCSTEPMLDHVQLWANINSGSGNLLGLQQMADMLAEAFAVLPGPIELAQPAKVDVVLPNGTRAPADHGRNLHLTVRPGAAVQLLLTGHMDTVYDAGHPFQTTSWRDRATLGGPGVADMKGGIAVMLAALRSVEESAAAKRLGYEVVINSDEEVGSPGSAALIAQAARGKHAALTYEPSILPDGTFAAARPGSGNFSLLVEGRGAHAGRNPEDGRNAVLAAADLALRLAAAAHAGLTVNPARIDGGGQNNVIPALAVLRVNLRPATKADEESARALLGSTTEAVEREHEVRISLHGGFGRPPKPLDRATEKLFSLVRSCGADLGQAVQWHDSGGVCDGNNIAAAGVPVIDTMGVRGGAIHSAEEYLIVDSLLERARLSTLALLRLAQGEGV